MKRPRKYFDRRWLEGYRMVAANVHKHRRPAIADRLSIVLRQSKPLTAYECGCVDALLDSVGC